MKSGKGTKGISAATKQALAKRLAKAKAKAELNISAKHTISKTRSAAAKPSVNSTSALTVSPELGRIVERVTDWAGGRRQALAWCREVGIPALGGLTAEELVAEGRAAAVVAFLDHIAVGGFA